MKDFEKDYRKWSKVALISVIILLFTITTIDAFLGFDFSRNMYVMSVVATGCVLALLSLTWIRLLNSKLMRSDLWDKDENEGKDKPAEALAPVEVTPKSISMSDVETYLNSVPELERFFPLYLNVLLHACGRQREIYHQLLEESASNNADKSISGVRESKVVS